MQACGVDLSAQFKARTRPIFVKERVKRGIGSVERELIWDRRERQIVEATQSANEMADLVRQLIREAKAGNKEGVGTLLEKGSLVDAEDTTGGTAMMSSASNGHLDVVKLLAAKGANIHHQNANGCTALLLAADNNYLPVCLFLISLGADPTAEDKRKRTALTCYGKSVSLTPTSTFDRHPAVNALSVTALKEARQAYLVTTSHHSARTNASLLISANFSDLVFVCPGGERIHAHRNIVAACSPHMNALLQGPWAENAGGGQASEVAMPQSAEAVRALLRFMYTGEVDAAACTSHTMDVLDLASQHEQSYLKTACGNHSGETLQSKNLLPIFEIALQHDMPALWAACIAFVEKNVVKLNLSDIVKFANKHNIPELKAACQRGAIAALSTANAVSSLEIALMYDFASLKDDCIAFVRQHIADLSLNELIQFADEHSVPELKAACERGCIAILSKGNVNSYIEAAHQLDLSLLKARSLVFVEKNMSYLRLSNIFQSAAWKSVPEIRAACERGCIANLCYDNVVSFLDTALQHGMPVLKGKCIALVSTHPRLIASKAFVDLANANPKLWDDLRAAQCSQDYF